MNVFDTLKQSLLNFPEIFPNAFTVYHHLFCVNGNGYEWKNGQATCIYKSELANDKNQDIINIEERMNDFTVSSFSNKYDFDFYPLCKYALLCNLPDDIQQDWLNAAIKMVEIMDAHQDMVNDPENLLPKIKERIHELYNKIFE